MSKLTVVIITKNEESNIDSCLKQLVFADEIILIDDNSTDKTLEIAKKYKVKVISNKLSSFSHQRNLALERASNSWVLFIDADETIDEKLREEILERISEETYDGYYIKRKDIFLGYEMKYGDLEDVRILRLGRKNSGMWEGDVHEKWRIKGKTSNLKNSLGHHSHQNLFHFIDKINYYSSIRANELKQGNIKSSFLTIALYPMFKFVILYFSKMGFRDGLPGFIHALFMSMYSFLVRGKLYLLYKDEK